MDDKEKITRKKIAVISGGIDEAYHSPFIGKLAETLNEAGHSLLWFTSLSDVFNNEPHDIGEVNIYNLINYKRIDAIILMTLTMKCEKSTQDILARAKENNVPVVSIDENIANAYNITLGYEEALYDMINHLIDVHGVKDISFIAGIKGNSASESRENIYRRVMSERGFELHEDSIGYGMFWSVPAMEWVQGYYDRRGIMPQAFVCANDSMALGVIEKLNSLGFKVPDDVIVTGIDGIDEALTYAPSITTVKLDPKLAGEVSAKRVLQILAGEISPAGNEVIDGEQLYRVSCGCPHANLNEFNNKVKHDLYDKINEWKSQSNQIVHRVESATGGLTFEETLYRMDIFLQNVWSRVNWLCISEGLISSVETIEDVYDSYISYQREGYSENIQYTLQYSDGGDKFMLPPFKTEEMLPDLDGLLEKYENIMFLPLHFRDRTIGYIAIEFTQTSTNYYILNTYVTNISTVVENARVQAELRNFVAKLEDMYIRDSMTNLYNRRGFYQFTPKLFEKCIYYGFEFMVISIDLNGLKTTNDVYGHKEGDNAITVTANALLAAAGKDDIIARFGGDEYVVAGINYDNNYADEFIKKFQANLDKYNESSGKPYLVQASCGIYKIVPDGSHPIDEFIRIADELMYKEKVEFKKRHNIARSTIR